MLLKKFISVVLAAALLASVCCISVSASGFTSANKANGTVTEVKGTTGSSPWERTHTGSSGTTRTSVIMKATSTVTGEKGLINVYDTSGNGYSGKFAHATFKLETNVGGIQIRIRMDNSVGNKQWMILDPGTTGGSIVPTSAGVSKGVTWSTGEHRIDIVSDLQNGMAYMYYDKQLAGYQTNLQTDGKWYGYLIYKRSGCTWNSGDYVKWSNYDHKDYQYTLYHDTADYTVSIEDVLVQAGIENAPSGDDSLILTTDKAKDYYATAYSPSVTFSGNSVTVSGDYYNSASGYAQAFYYMLSGFYQDGNIYPGGGLIYVSYDQQISAGSRIEIRLRSGSSNNNNNRLQFLPNSGKIKVYAFDNTQQVLTKNWNDSIKVGIVVDIVNKKAYVLIDGEPIGDSFTYSNDFRDLRLYMNGTSDNSVSTVTFSNWSMRVYDTSKLTQRLINEERRDRVMVANMNDVMPEAAIPTFTASPSDDATTLGGMTVVSGDGKTLDLTGGYTVVFGSTDYSVTDLPDRYGMAVYKNDNFAGCYEAKSFSGGGKYGVLIFGTDVVDPGATYTMKNCVKYDSDGGSWIVAK